MIGRNGILFVSIGLAVMGVLSGATAHLVGLGVWWVGVLLLVHSLIGGGRAAQALWGLGVVAAVVAYTAGGTESLSEGAGRWGVAAVSLVLVVVALKRMGRSPRRSATPSHSADGHVRSALTAWSLARKQVSNGQPLRAGLTYQDGINHLLSCISMSRDDLVPVYHAMAAMGREALPVMEQVKATTPVRFHARMTLAAAHLADPTGGKPELIKETLAADSAPGPDLNGDGPLTAEARIAGAAQTRLLVARLMVDRPDLRWEAVPPWEVGSGDPVSLGRQKKRFRQAVLPSCAGLSPAEEMRRLAQESVLMYTELCQAAPGYEQGRDRAGEILATIRT